MTTFNFYKKAILLITAFISFNTFAAVTFPASTYQALNYGLYWFGYTDVQKAEPGAVNPYYDANKPTFIYVHGWQKGSVEEQRRSTFDRGDSAGASEDLSQYWLDRGYNVGILYWNQFADEGEVRDAEAKIHTTEGPQGMRWKSLDGTYHSGPNKNITQLLFESIRDNMGDYSNDHFRIAGHSLGNQLALSISNELNSAVENGLNANLLPDRIALLDPFYSKGAQDYLNGQWTGEIARNTADTLKSANVILETYRSSLTGSSGIAGDKNVGLMNKTAFTELRPWYLSFWEISNKHSAAVNWYFWSITFDASQMESNQGNAPSAATSDASIRKLMNANYCTRQSEGAYTLTPEDDMFQMRDRL